MSEEKVTIMERGIQVIAESVLSGGQFEFPGDRVVQVSSGEQFSAIVFQSGHVFTFGENDHGQLGHKDKKMTSVIRPTQVAALESTEIVQVSCGIAFTLFLTAEGEVYSCGSNHYGQLGHGDKSDKRVPTKVKKIPAIKMLAAGGHHSILVAETGELYVAGSNEYGQLGLGGTKNQSVFIPVPSIRATITSVLGGRITSAFVVKPGNLFMCGRNYNGQLGLGSHEDSDTFQQVTLPCHIKAASCGWDHTVALTTDGAVWSWGQNSNGQLGISSNLDSTSPVRMAGLEGLAIADVFAGCKSSAMVTADGEVLMCGVGHALVLGQGGNLSTTPTLVTKARGLRVKEASFANTHVALSVV